jgi:hypothetical protein
MGLALAQDLSCPAVYRVGYQAGLKRLFIAWDFGLSKDTVRFPGSAPFRFVVYPFDQSWGFRAAWKRYMELFPEFFVVRARDQGIWMPFTDVSTVQGWEDFGFRFHEGNNNVPWDDAHGILSFRYTEPMTWWMAMKKEAPRTLASALATREEMIKTGKGHESEMASVCESAGMQDESGGPCLQFRDEPWCHGAVWSLNPNPYLSGGTNAATIYWNPRIKEQLYGASAKGHLDGEYLDSLEGYLTADLNYRREHFRETTVPLAFSTEEGLPALYKGLCVYEFTRWLADDVHRQGSLMFANSVPYKMTWLCPWLDVMGTETDWMQNGQYRPVSESTLALWRTLSGAKPYLLLMNTDYDKFTYDLVERYFHQSLFYGMFPGMFSHNASENPYWQNPKWYNRDRPLFLKYMPIIKQVAQAGWQPVTQATTDQPSLKIERFGPTPAGWLYFTVFNSGPAKQSGHVQIKGAPEWGAITECEELVAPRKLTSDSQGWPLELQSGQTAVLKLKTAN